ncbi:MAG: hydantoinase B/oxoprolinase family protein [Dehalococcoidales bacterium]|nr:hydantoinase B/oxoprolinase family protein [Dehalococcoidales bacterium]
MAKVDPITFAVVQNKLLSAANGMLDVASSSGVSSFIGQVRDCSFAILDQDAGIIAQSIGILLFLGSLGPGTKNCIDVIGKENIEPDDVIISNLPDVTGSHSSDAILFTPIFYKGKIFGYASTKAHWQDMGAKNTYPVDATNIYEEGLRIPPVKLFRKGILQKEVLDIIRWNSRAPDQVWGDIQAQISGCRYAENRVREILDQYGIDQIRDIVREMYDYSERMTRLAIEKIGDGVWSAEDIIDNNGIDLDKPIKIKVTVTVRDSDITVDFSDSDPEQKGPMNGLWVTTLSAARMSIKALTTPHLTANEGCNRPVTVIAPKGCVYNAGPTAPSFLCGDVASTILELINKAMWQAVSDKVPACSGGSVCGGGYYGIDPRTGRQWATLSSPAIGQGGDCFGDGDSYSGHHSIGGGSGSNFEVFESSFPLFVENFELIPDSGGAGKHRGGLGMELNVRVLHPSTLFRFIEKARAEHFGLDGGKPGLRNYAVVKSGSKGEFEVLKIAGLDLEPDDIVSAIGGGGGGYGNPLERDPQAVLRDVINGYVSIEGARRDYGVVIDPGSLRIDIRATHELRSKSTG